MQLTATPTSWPDGSFTIGAASAHPGGVNALMGDASVRFVKDQVTRDVWWRLATRAGGEIIDANAY